MGEHDEIVEVDAWPTLDNIQNQMDKDEIAYNRGLNDRFAERWFVGNPELNFD